MKKSLFVALLLGWVVAAYTQEKIRFNERPKLVVGIVVDQMRWDYLSRYYDRFGKGGFRRLIEGGYSCDNTLINYVPTVTAAGHASIYTGSTPAFHGIAGNNFMIEGVRQSSVRDTSVTVVGTDVRRVGQASPHMLLATTIGDQLKVHTDFRSKVYSFSFKDRAAVLPGGHTADGAFWLDTKNLQFVTSTYYMKELPEWVSRYNAGKMKEYAWMRTLGDTMVYSPLINQMVIDLAKETVLAENLGRHDVTDMIALSFSQTDYIGHKYGTRGWQTDNVYKELDSQLAEFLTFLDKQVGRGNYLLFLTADHGAVHNNVFMEEHKLPAGIWRVTDVQRKLENHLGRVFGTGKLLLGIMEYRIYLDHKKIKEKHLDLDEVKADLVGYLRSQKHVAYAVDFEQVQSATIPEPLRERITRGWNADRSGDIQVILEPGYYYFAPTSSAIGTTHAAWNPYDSHIPLLFYGWKVPHGSTSRQTRIVDIAPTICSMLHIQMPNACIGDAIELK